MYDLMFHSNHFDVCLKVMSTIEIFPKEKINIQYCLKCVYCISTLCVDRHKRKIDIIVEASQQKEIDIKALSENLYVFKVS